MTFDFLIHTFKLLSALTGQLKTLFLKFSFSEQIYAIKTLIHKKNQLKIIMFTMWSTHLKVRAQVKKCDIKKNGGSSYQEIRIFRRDLKDRVIALDQIK